MEDNYYLSLSQINIIKFDAVNQLTNVYFDECRSQIFIVKSAAISVKSLDSKNGNFSFNLQSNNSNLIAIKFSDENNVLAVQRTENNLELVGFKNNQVVSGQIIYYETKQKQGTIIYGFIWTEHNELIVVTADAVEIFQINMAKRQMKCIKTVSASSNFFCYSRSNFLLLSSNNGLILTPILIKQGNLTKLAPIQIDDGQAVVTERDIITGTIYGCNAILILKTARNRTLEIFVYLLEIPTFKKKHVLKLALNGRCAVSIIDSIIVVHHQNSKVSLLFDVALNEETDPNDKSIMIHNPLVVAKSIKPFSIKLPTVSLKNEMMMNFELYSVNWVIFNEIIIDVKLGYLFKLELAIDKVQIGDKIRLISFLMHRQNAKSQLLAVLSQLIANDYEEIHLTMLEIIFDKLNKVYKHKLDNDLLKLQALPSPSGFKSFTSPPAPVIEQPKEAVVIEQSDMLHIFNTIVDKNILEKILMSYIYSLVKNSITCEYDLSKTLVMTLVGSNKIHDLQQILSFQILLESKPLACFLLSLANHDPLISQMSLDMLKRLGAHEIIIEILLEQGKVIDAMRLAKLCSNVDTLSARKYLEAALKDDNKMTFYSIYNFFLSRNQRLRGNSEFLKSEQCENYVKAFEQLFPAA